MCAGGEVFTCLFFGVKNSRCFHHILHAEVFPGQAFRVFLGIDLDLMFVDDDAIFRVANLGVEDAVNAVIFKEICQGFGIGEIVYRHHFDLGMVGEDGAQDQSANASKSVYRYSNHDVFLSPIAECCYLRFR